MDTLLTNDLLTIGKKQFTSRLMLGTGKYKNFQEAKEAISISGCQILTVAVRRAQSANVEGIDTLLQNLDWSKKSLLLKQNDVDRDALLSVIRGKWEVDAATADLLHLPDKFAAFAVR